MKLIGDKITTKVKHLTKRLKIKYLPELLKRDGGFRCFYCIKDLDIRSYINEHLNNDRTDNRKENIVLACHTCNNKKPNNSSLQLKAIQKLKNNERNFMSEREISGEIQTQEASTEIEINVSNYDIVNQFIGEVVNTDGSIPLKVAINSGAYLCKEKTGHGATQTVRNYIEMLVSDVGPFRIIRDETKKKVIIKRTDELTIQNQSKNDNFYDHSKVKK